MRRALDEFIIEGIQTTINLHKQIIASEEFTNYEYDIKWLESYLENK